MNRLVPASLMAGLALLALTFALGVRWGRHSAVTAAAQHAPVAVETLQPQLALRLGQINAHLLRLDALGKRLQQMACIDSSEFDFDTRLPLALPPGGWGSLLELSEQRLDSREAQLLALETWVLSRRLDEALKPGGRPLRGAAVSSGYGDRQDPISGREALHQGVDFAALRGTTVVAVAAGVVAASGYQTGLGQYVDINHGNGYVTRYGHNQRALVVAGQVVARGQPIATLGSSGRATGPHLHFEVLRDGRPVDPLGYLGR